MNGKKISIPVHNNRIAPLFDVARNFIIVDTYRPKKKLFINTSGLSGMSIIEKLNDSCV